MSAIRVPFDAIEILRGTMWTFIQGETDMVACMSLSPPKSFHVVDLATGTEVKTQRMEVEIPSGFDVVPDAGFICDASNFYFVITDGDVMCGVSASKLHRGSSNIIRLSKFVCRAFLLAPDVWVVNHTGHPMFDVDVPENVLQKVRAPVLYSSTTSPMLQDEAFSCCAALEGLEFDNVWPLPNNRAVAKVGTMLYAVELEGHRIRFTDGAMLDIQERHADSFVVSWHDASSSNIIALEFDCDRNYDPVVVIRLEADGRLNVRHMMRDGEALAGIHFPLTPLARLCERREHMQAREAFRVAHAADGYVKMQ